MRILHNFYRKRDKQQEYSRIKWHTASNRKNDNVRGKEKQAKVGDVT
jgi:hypothetical protein